MTTTKRSNVAATLRTTVLMAALGGILVAIGFAIGGPQGGLVFLGIALVINFFSYWFSAKIALRSSGAKPVTQEEAPELHRMIDELRTRAGLPMPGVYVIPQTQANAFATGRNPKNAAVAVTQGILEQLSPEELKGVIAHELAHIKNYDILTQSVAAAIGSAITWIGYMILWFGDNDSPIGLVASLAIWLLAPISATLIQLAISRQREFGADASGAELCGNPEALASALLRLEGGAAANPMDVNAATESMYIIKPFSGGGFTKLFSTHPPTEERVRRLRQMRPAIV
jgi:heat shock protein HtpX